MAGLHKHKWSYTVKYAPDHFGHNEFKPPNRVVTRKWLNLHDLPRLVSVDFAGSGEQPVDLEALGYDKLLGGGNVENAYHLKISRASSSALEKIKAAGGSVKLTQVERPTSGDGDGKGSKQASK